MILTRKHPERTFVAATERVPVHPYSAWDRLLIGSFLGLIVARLQLPGNDPGRLSLTSGIADVAWNILFLILVLAACVRAAVANNSQPVLSRSALILLGIVGVSLFNTLFRSAYARPGYFATGEWIIAVLVLLFARTIPATPIIRSRIVALLLTCVISTTLADLYNLYAPRLGWPDAIPRAATGHAALVGDAEFESWRNKPPDGRFGWLVLTVGMLPLFWLLVRNAKSLAGRIIAILLAILPLIPIALWGQRLIPEFQKIAVGLNEATQGWNRVIGAGFGTFERYLNEALVVPPAIAIVAGAGVIGIILGVGFVLGFRIRSTVSAEKPPEAIAKSQWEFYLAGLVGLVLPLFLKLTDMPPEVHADEFLRIAGFEAGRAILWFALLGYFERLDFTAIGLRRAEKWSFYFLAIGGLFLCCGFNARWLIALTFFAGLLAPASMAPSRPLSPLWIWLRCPLALGLLVLYVMVCALPAGITNASIREARRASLLLPTLSSNVKTTLDAEQIYAIWDADEFLIRKILEPLAQAEYFDPKNSAVRLETARWGLEHWKNRIQLSDPEETKRWTVEILKDAEIAIALDPLNPAGHRCRLEAIFVFLSNSKKIPDEAVPYADEDITSIAARSPQEEVALLYRLAKLLANAESPAAETVALELFRRNRQEGQPHGSLADADRRSLAKQIVGQSKKPHPEIVEESKK